MSKNTERLKELVKAFHPCEGGGEDFLLIRALALKKPVGDNELQEIQQIVADELNDGCQVKVRRDDQAGILNITIENFAQEKLNKLLQALQSEESAATTG